MKIEPDKIITISHEHPLLDECNGKKIQVIKAEINGGVLDIELRVLMHPERQEAMYRAIDEVQR